MAGAPVASIGQMSLGPIEAGILSLNSNPYFIGTMMLMLNLGGRFLSLEMSKSQEAFFQNVWVRRFLIFIVVFVGTRNVVVAFWMTLLIVLLIGYLFNENSSLCLFTLAGSEAACGDKVQSKGPTPTPSQIQAQMTPASPFTPEEADIFKRLNEKQLRFSATQRKEQTRVPEEFPSAIRDVYWQNMTLLKGVEAFQATPSNPRF